MKSQESYRAKKREIKTEMQAGLLKLAVALARTSGCDPNELLPSYGPKQRSANKRRKNYSPDELVDTKEAGVILGLSKKTLENWRCQGKGPAFKSIGNRCHYRVRDLEAYLAANTFGSTSEYKER